MHENHIVKADILFTSVFFKEEGDLSHSVICEHIQSNNTIWIACVPVIFEWTPWLCIVVL